MMLSCRRRTTLLAPTKQSDLLSDSPSPKPLRASNGVATFSSPAPPSRGMRPRSLTNCFPMIPTERGGELVYAIFIDDKFVKFVPWLRGELVDVDYEGTKRSLLKPITVGDTTYLSRLVESHSINLPTLEKEVAARPVAPSYSYTEGAVQSVMVNRYERDRKARTACINHWGATCFCCGMDFKSVYGDVGEEFIHVHHIRPIAEIGESYSVDPTADLRPVCPNCHAMLHRNPPATIASLQTLFGHHPDET